MRWKQWAVALSVLAVCIAIIDIATETHAIAASALFVWSATVASVRFMWSAIELGVAGIVRAAGAIVPVVLRRRAWRLVTDIPASIGFGYLAGLFLSGRHLKRSQKFFARYRATIFRARKGWQDLTTRGKFAVVIGLIVTQIILFPTISKYVVVFPVRFMVPIFTELAKRVYGTIADSIVGVLYRRYCGRAHNATVGYVRTHPLTRSCSRRIGILRLQHATAWRMWRHDACYRREDGKRRISIREPIKLWRRGELNKYVGHPLFASKKSAHESLPTA